MAASSRGQRAMRRGLGPRLTLLMAMAGLWALGAGTPPPALADCQSGPVWPIPASRAVGTTFMARYLGGYPFGEGRDRWRVERVYTGDLRTGRITGLLGGSGCHAARFRAGVAHSSPMAPGQVRARGQ